MWEGSGLIRASRLFSLFKAHLVSSLLCFVFVVVKNILYFSMPIGQFAENETNEVRFREIP